MKERKKEGAGGVSSNLLLLVDGLLLDLELQDINMILLGRVDYCSCRRLSNDNNLCSIFSSLVMFMWGISNSGQHPSLPSN